MASLRPSPVMLLMPLLGDAATTSWPRWRRMATVFEPIRPVPPMTTIFIAYTPNSSCAPYETLSLTHVVPDARACGLVSFCYQLALGISPEQAFSIHALSRCAPRRGQRIAHAAVVVIRERTQRRCAIAAKRRPMHEREGARRELRKRADGRAHVRGEARISEQILGRNGRPD